MHFLCHKKNMRTLFFVAKTINALRPESFCMLKVAIWKVQTFGTSALYILKEMKIMEKERGRRCSVMLSNIFRGMVGAAEKCFTD